jgi:hypothetical protein
MGYVFMLNGGAVSWESCKQDLVAQSKMESEYMTSSEAASEGVRLCKFVIELGVFSSMGDPVDILCDNMAAITNTKELRAHSVVKHILQHYHVIRDYERMVKLEFAKFSHGSEFSRPVDEASSTGKV